MGDIPELAHLDNSYGFLRDPCFHVVTFSEYSFEIHRIILKSWIMCASQNPAFKQMYADQLEYCRVTRKQNEQSLLMMLEFAQTGSMIVSSQEHDPGRGFCGWMGFTVVEPEKFIAFISQLHHGNADNYLRALFRRVSLVPRNRSWRNAFQGYDDFIFAETL